MLKSSQQPNSTSSQQTNKVSGIDMSIRNVVLYLEEKIPQLEQVRAEIASRGGDVNPFIAEIIQLHIDDLKAIQKALTT